MLSENVLMIVEGRWMMRNENRDPEDLEHPISLVIPPTSDGNVFAINEST